MLKAFKELGYNVFEVIGTGKERAEAIKKIKNEIKAGLKVEFMYAESATYPTLLATGINDFVKYFNQDFSFFKYLKKNNIPIGLYYRDIHWLFPHGKGKHGFFKEKVFNFFYKFDLTIYEKYVDVLFLPSTRMYNHLPLKKSIPNYSLPPGTKIKNIGKRENDTLNLVYIGGVSNLYKMDKLFPVLNNCDFVRCNISTRQKEWEEVKKNFIDYKNYNIFHFSGNELEKLFVVADIGLIFTEPHKYWDFAMPVKLFEYLSFGLPIIAIKNTAAGEFVEKNNVGWTVDYDEFRLSQLLQMINGNRKQLLEKKKFVYRVAEENSWNSRVEKVNSILLKDNNYGNGG